MEPNLSHDTGAAVGNRALRVLVVRIGAMGDVLHAMPAVSAMRELHPEWVIDWAIEPAWSELLEIRHGGARAARDARRPLVDRRILVPTRNWKRRPWTAKTAREILALRGRLRVGSYDLCVDMQGSIRSAVTGRMAGAEDFVGLAEPREGPAAWFYRRKVLTTAQHVVEQGCELLGYAIGEELRPARVALPVDAVAEAWCDGLLSGLGHSFVLVAPTAGWGAKQWPAERYGALAAALGHSGFRTLVNASSAEDTVAKRVVETSDGAAVMVPCSVGQLIALVRRAALVVAGDTGPLHLAAVLERPVVGLYGPTDPARNGPYGAASYGTRSRVLRHASSVLDHSRHVETERGLLEISVDEVVAAALELLGVSEKAGQDKV
jgi:heptosyltransferase I